MAYTIRNIVEITERMDSRDPWIGYRFLMEDPAKNVICKISADRNCCEEYGLHVTAYDSNGNMVRSSGVPQHFVGATYTGIEFGECTHEDPTHKYPTYEDPDSGDTYLTIVIYTNRGKINLLFYNLHNGYYPHDVDIQTEDGCKTFTL